MNPPDYDSGPLLSEEFRWPVIKLIISVFVCLGTASVLPLIAISGPDWAMILGRRIGAAIIKRR